MVTDSSPRREEMTVAEKGDNGFTVGRPRKVQYYLIPPVNRGTYPKWGWDFPGYDTQISHPTSKQGLT